jgi:hypothetical protein
MRPCVPTSRLAIILLPLLPILAPAADPLGLARAGRYTDLAAVGAAALPPLLDAYPTADRETRTAILFALGSLNIKSPAAKTVLDTDVDGEDSSFQDLHRYALAVVDPAIRSADLHELVTAEGIALDPEIGRFMYATLVTTYEECDARVAHARRYVAGLAAADPKARYAAIVSLRIMTGASHAYHPLATDAAREEPLRAWRRWLRRLEQSCHA